MQQYQTQYEAGRASDILEHILGRKKTVEVRLAKGKFLDFKPGELISLREDFYEDGKLVRSEPDQAVSRVVEVRRYDSFRVLFEAEGLKATMPWHKSIDEAVAECRRFYSEGEEEANGVLAIEFELVRGRPQAADSDAVELNELQFFTDGGSRGNPGPSASGIVILDMNDNVVEEFGVFLGITTNNQAEYLAIKFALEAIAKYKPTRVHSKMDSELACKQLNGIYRVKNVDLQPIYAQIKELSKQYDITFEHVYREFNKLADRQVNLAIDQALGIERA